ncbi:ABC-type transport auxiliary lipoprotein family protein [Ignatzschineria sp. LJL83]
MNLTKKITFITVLALFLTACASAPVKKSYILSTDTQNIIASDAKLPSLSISQIRSLNKLSTDMQYSRSKNEIESFTKSDWVAPPPQMLQAAITQDLEARNLFQYVVMAPNSVSTQYRLDVTIIEMNQFFNEADKSSHVVLKLQARLVNNSTNRIIRSISLSKQEPSTTYDAEGGVIAYNKALQSIADQLSQSLSQSARR